MSDISAGLAYSVIKNALFKVIKLAEMYEPDKKTPAVIEFVDIAGLVKGASQGAGLGNKFLENIRRTDAIVKAHGSDITAENRKSGGAAFRFALERGGEDDGQ